jgi:hypothetical protein
VLTDVEMEDLIWGHAERLLDEPLRRSERLPTSPPDRSCLVFFDRVGRLLIVELRRGTLASSAIEQIRASLDVAKQRYPGRAVRSMVVANYLPAEIALACKRSQIAAIQIPEATFRVVSLEADGPPAADSATDDSPARRLMVTPSSIEPQRPASMAPKANIKKAASRPAGKRERDWYHWTHADGRAYFIVFVNQFGSCSMRWFDANDGAFCFKPKNEHGDYQLVYTSYLRSGTLLQVPDPPNLEKVCREGRLPDPVLDELKRRLRKQPRR